MIRRRLSRCWVRTAAVGLATSMLVGAYFVGTAAADESRAVTTVHSEPLIDGAPCTAGARACVDLDTKQAWLIDRGEVVRGPVRIGIGGPGQETPVGHSLRVYLKDADHVSSESRLPDGRPAPMPWAVFFNDGGIAFHGGDPRRASAGCIRLPSADARAWFESLQVGDLVQVVRGREERAERDGKRRT